MLGQAGIGVENGDGPPAAVGHIGAGFINRSIARFLAVALPGISRLHVFDLNIERAVQFARDVREASGRSVEIEVAASLGAVLRICPLVSFATTAIRPYVAELSSCPTGAAILHISLRDLSPG